MSDLAERLANLSPAQRQLLEKRLAKERAPAADRPPAPIRTATAEPIAVIGMACRFPGAPSLDAYWRLIRDQINAACEVPADRWNPDEFYDPSGESPGKMSVRWAALIDGPDQFDPQFFGITPREASRMDPQQRLLLEVAWEAMENAGRPADQMAGTRTGVFVGIGGTDYSKVAIPYDDYYEHVDAHMGTGNALSIAANRVSYIFDLHGPSAAVDTACSSASLAIHFAVESLRRGESDAALAGGVNMILTPETTIAFSKARMLSPEGVCRPFDAGANGYVRGEGCGLVLLKRLVDAERDGDRIFAVLRATSVNQDGRTSGISAPNGQSQIACIRAALKQAGVTPDDIDYIEAHGTGTPLGDPIEMQALGEIFRTSDSTASPCYVASVKANVGHMETVSGVASLIKVALMMQRDEIPAQTHFKNLNPHINLSGTRLAIPTEHRAWPRASLPRLAGVSSFGFGGTNTHLVMESHAAKSVISREPTIAGRPTRKVDVLKFSGKTERSVIRQAEQLAAYLAETPAANIADVCYSANTGRADFNHRAAITAEGIGPLRERLGRLAKGEIAAGVKQASVRALGRPKCAFLFTGQGSQYTGMGHGLYESQPVFRGALCACDDILREIWDGESLLDILYPKQGGDALTPLIHETEYTQPALFALEYALAELWRSWGVAPDIVLGHSVGEYTAACVAGVMNLEDGLALIAERARLMQSVKRPGKMAVVFASRDRVARVLKDASGEIVIAVVNGPENTVISGDVKGVDKLVETFTADGVQVQALKVSHAFHSPLMDEMLDEFEQFARTIHFKAPQVPLVANLTGRLMTEAPNATYWRDHLRNTVQFADGMARIAEAKPTFVLEMGPTASLIGMGRRCVPELEAAWLPSLRQGQGDEQTIAGSIAEFYARGGRVDWRSWDKPWQRSRLLLPNYPFERSRHWYTLKPELRRTFAIGGEATSAAGIGAGQSSGHALLGTRMSTVWSNTLFETTLSSRSPAYLNDHRVQGSPVTPAAAYIEQGLAAAEHLFGEGRHGLTDIVIQQAMFLPESIRRRVQVSVSPESGGASTFEVYSVPAGEAASTNDNDQTAWTMHATGRLIHEANAEEENPTRSLIDIDAVQKRAAVKTSRADFYKLMAERGLAYGPAFQVLDDIHRGSEQAIARVVLPEAARSEASQYHLHPALGDALLQSMAGAVPVEADGSFSPFTYMPVGVRSIHVARKFDDYSQPLFTYAVRTSTDSNPSPERVEGDVYLVDARGETLVALEGVVVQRLGRSASGTSTTDTAEWLYQIAWQPQPLQRISNGDGQSLHEPNTIDGSWLIFADKRGVGRALAGRLAERGQSSVVVEAGAKFASDASDAGNGQAGSHATAQIDPLDKVHYQRLLETAFLASRRPCLGVVHLWSIDIPDADTDANAWESARRLGCGSAVQLLSKLARATELKSPPLWLVTTGAQHVGNTTASRVPIAVEQSPLWGLGRAAGVELPDLSPRLIDLDPVGVVNDVAEAAGVLADELAASDDSAGNNESQIAFRDGYRFVARLVRAESVIEDTPTSASRGLAIPKGKPYQLRITQSGSFDALRFAPVDREPPQPGQVEIEVRAAGLNFSDVLKALGLYPGIKDVIVPLGIEASGVVTAVGNGVNRFCVGDEVFGVVPYAFASHARTAEYALVHKPKSVDHDEACTIPITFLTAYYGLVRLAQLQPGERVLIHAAAGGVGLAAIQIAQQIGAEVFATAGSNEKREYLRSLGVERVYSSRSTAFADEILADTNRQGVDVVLNSLPGEAITKSLSTLRAYGRFLEIGKTDIYQNRMIGLLPFQDNLSYFAIDLDRMLRQRPEYIRQLFADVMQHFDAGDYQPLMFTRFETEGTIDAFRYMSQRKNIGKVVVSIESADSGAENREPSDSGSQLATLDSRQLVVRRDGTYLISGGLGALGLRVAEWLAEQGAGPIALLSRRGPSANVEAKLASIRRKGVDIITLQGDVADAKSLAAALTQLAKNAPPLRGVVHAAGVLADGVLIDMSLDQLDRAIVPKANGAWNLHAATLNQPLDFFVLFSSVASILGSPGQANYAAGNAMLDVLAHARRAQGLPAMSINWGPWAESGMAAEAGRGEAVKSRGVGLIPPEQGLDLLGKLFRADATQVAVMHADWNIMLRMMGSRRPALLSQLAEEIEERPGAQASGRIDQEFRKRFFEADAATGERLVRDYIQHELARIMGVETAKLETDQPLSTFGLDSLLALELKNNLESRLDFTLPMAKLLEGPSIASLAEETAQLLRASRQAAHDGESTSAATSEEEDWTPLLALRATGSRPPLILLPALGGDVRCYADLVQHLGEDQPVYAFRPRGVDQDLLPHQTMDEMIADYAAALRALQPHGPYNLGGWSTGGIYALALAEALVDAAEQVGLLAFFDTPLPSICDEVDVADDARFLCNLVNYANRFAGTDVQLNYNELAASTAEERFQTVLSEAKVQGIIPSDAPEDFIRRLVQVGEANVRVIQGYEPRAFAGPIHLFVPLTKGGLAEVSGRETPADADNGWIAEVNQELELYEVPGDHFTMMTGDSAEQIAWKLASLLQVTEDDGRRSTKDTASTSVTSFEH